MGNAQVEAGMPVQTLEDETLKGAKKNAEVDQPKPHVGEKQKPKLTSANSWHAANQNSSQGKSLKVEPVHQDLEMDEARRQKKHMEDVEDFSIEESPIEDTHNSVQASSNSGVDFSHGNHRFKRPEKSATVMNYLPEKNRPSAVAAKKLSKIKSSADLAFQRASEEMGRQIDPELKEALGGHEHQHQHDQDGVDQPEKTTFETDERDLVLAFRNIDRDRDRKITGLDVIRELKRINPMYTADEIFEFQRFLSTVIMDEYSTSKNGVWTFGDFQHFMHDALHLEKTYNKGKDTHATEGHVTEKESPVRVNSEPTE